MNEKTIIIALLIFFICIFMSCDIYESDDNNYDYSVSNNSVTLLIKNGTVSSPGEIKVINYSNQRIFIPFILYPICNFSIYALDFRNDNVWMELSFDEFENEWTKRTKQDSVFLVCDEYRNPIEINPYQIFEQTLSKVGSEGEYRLKINFRYSQRYDSHFSDNELIINYFVK